MKPWNSKFRLSTAILLCGAAIAYPTTIDENTAGPSFGTTGFYGESFITPASSSFNNIVFTFLSTGGANFAAGTGFLLDSEYLGSPANLSSSTPGFVAQATASGNLYTFAPSATLAPNKTYYFYENVSIPAGTILGGNVYAGHQFYYSSASSNNFVGQGGPLNFRVTGTAITGNSTPTPTPTATPGTSPTATPTATATTTPGASPTPTATTTPGSGPPGLQADYQFQNTRASSVGTAPALVDDGSGNGFSTDTVDCVSSRTVLNFPAGGGLALAPTTGVIPNKTYTIVILFKFAEQDKDRAIVDFKNGGDGRGIYALSDNNLAFYNSFNNAPGISNGSGKEFVKNKYLQVVLTRTSNGGNGGVDTGYVNGVKEYENNTPNADGVIDETANRLRFFINLQNGQYSAGSVARIRLFDRALSASEVAGLDRLPGLNCTAPSPTPTPTSTPGGTPGLMADYQFQNTRGSSVGTPPALVDELGSNSFASDTVGCSSRTVLNFPTGSGLALAPTTGVIPNKTYSIVMLFKFAEQDKDRAIVDFKNGGDGRGIYALSDNNLAFSNSFNNGPGISIGSGKEFVANKYVQVVLTRTSNGGNGGVDTGYVNGVKEYENNTPNADGVIDETANRLRFFINLQNGQYSAGSVARIRLFNYALSASEVAALDQLPGVNCPSPTPTSTPTATPTPATTATPTATTTPTTSATPTSTPTSTGTPTASPSPTPGQGQEIVFETNRAGGETELYTMNADGTNPTRLTNNSVPDSFPSYAPDGRIAFVRGGNFPQDREIYIMNADGSNQTRLTNNSAADDSPSFSADGSRIVFISNRDGGDEIYVMNSDGTNQKRLTRSAPGVSNFDPSFSPDGSRIVFTYRNQSFEQEIYVMDANGTNQRRLTNNPGLDDAPTFSPDGSRIAFVSSRNGAVGDVYLMNADGSNQRRLTTGMIPESPPSFSPDGSRIAFDSIKHTPFQEIFVINTDGTNLTRLTTNSVDRWPSWRRPVRTLAPARLANISTRLRVQTGDNVLIGGFIVTGTQPKKVIVRGIGTSLPLAGKLENPTLELHGPSGLIDSNDNWVDSPNKQAIIDTTIPPSNNLESAIVQTLPANSAGYTAVVRGANNGTGIGVVEAYDLNLTADSKLANISTRGFVETGDNVLFAGTIIVGEAAQKVIIRAIGPSLTIPNKMENPTLELRNSEGTLWDANDDWVDSPNKQAIIDSTIPPSNNLESAIVATLPANGLNFTAIVRGVNNTTGIAVVEVYALQ